MNEDQKAYLENILNSPEMLEKNEVRSYLDTELGKIFNKYLIDKEATFDDFEETIIVICSVVFYRLLDEEDDRLPTNKLLDKMLAIEESNWSK
jgi:hypothetical protein